MKKIFSIITLFSAILFATPNKSNAQVFEEGNVVVDVYYGFPNLYSSVFKSAYANANTTTNVNISGFGPVGIRGEYLLTDKFGMGLDIGMNASKLKFNDVVYDNNNNPQIYEYNYKTQKVGVMITFNYHFIDNDKVDFYGMFGVGYGNRTFKFDSTDPNNTNVSVKSLIPVASRIGIGMRYFFTDNIGFNVGAGFGQGGLLNAGLSFKF